MVVDSGEQEVRFRRARQAHRDGDLQSARTQYEEILAAQPQHVHALHALAEVCVAEAQLERAETLLRRALQFAPRRADLHGSLGRVLQLLGRSSDALDAYRTELEIAPDSAVGHHQAGVLLLASERLDAAIGHLQEAVKLAPDSVAAALDLGRALCQARRFADAERVLSVAVRLDPNATDAQAQLGHALFAQQRFDAARLSFEQALTLQPDHGSAHRGLGLLAAAAGHTHAALDHFAHALASAPRDVAALRAMGDLYSAEGLVDQALERYRQALQIDPYDADLLTQAAVASQASGDEVAALDYFSSALAQKSSHQEALSGFALLTAARGDARLAVARLAPTVNAGRAGPVLLATYAQLLGELGRRREGITLLEAALQKTLPNDFAQRLHFTLAQLLDKDKSYDLAFYHCRRANAMVRSSFDPQAFRARIERTIKVLDRAALASLPQVSSQPAVFIVGMPRSGLDVCRHVLAGHPELHVKSASTRLESGVLALWKAAGVPWPELAPAWSAGQFEDTAQRIAGRRTPDPLGHAFVKTSWRNFLYLGLVSRLFPDARVIECVRDPRDVALSCYFLGSAVGNQLPFSNDLSHIAAYYSGYRRLMDHWRQVVDLPMLTVAYEELALQPHATCESMATFLDIQWEPAHFALGTEVQDAASAHPWRLVARSVRRYRHYRQNLEAFVEAMDELPGEQE